MCLTTHLTQFTPNLLIEQPNVSLRTKQSRFKSKQEFTTRIKALHIINLFNFESARRLGYADLRQSILCAIDSIDLTRNIEYNLSHKTEQQLKLSWIYDLILSLGLDFINDNLNTTERARTSDIQEIEFMKSLLRGTIPDSLDSDLFKISKLMNRFDLLSQLHDRPLEISFQDDLALWKHIISDLQRTELMSSKLQSPNQTKLLESLNQPDQAATTKRIDKVNSSTDQNKILDIENKVHSAIILYSLRLDRPNLNEILFQLITTIISESITVSQIKEVIGEKVPPFWLATNLTLALTDEPTNYLRIIEVINYVNQVVILTLPSIMI
jgi:hypothetical protein